MTGESPSSDAAALEQRIVTLTQQLADAKAQIQQWTHARATLAQSAAEARAKNQATGRGMIGAFLGAKYRKVVRAGVPSANAAIANEVADKRGKISEGKRLAQEHAREVQRELTAVKQELKALTSRSRSSARIAKSRVDSIELLHKLKEARDAGVLTEAEYEEKRRKLVADL